MGAVPGEVEAEVKVEDLAWSPWRRQFTVATCGGSRAVSTSALTLTSIPALPRLTHCHCPGTILQIHYFSRTVRLHNRLHDTDVPEPLLARD